MMIDDLKGEERNEGFSTEDNGNREPKDRVTVCKASYERYSFVWQAS